MFYHRYCFFLIPEYILESEMLDWAESGDELGVKITLTAEEAVDILPVLNPLLLESFHVSEGHVLDSLEDRFVTALGKTQIPQRQVLIQNAHPGHSLGAELR